jgi:hypothetical protein
MAIDTQTVQQLMPMSTFAGLPYAQQQAYIASLPAAQQALYQHAMQAGQDSDNRSFMLKTRGLRQLCLQSSGSAQSQSYNAGQLLSFSCPQVLNGYVRGFWIRAQLVVTCAAGTSALYSVAAGAPLNAFSDCEIIYGRTVHKFSPYILKYVWQLRGYLRQSFFVPPVGGQTVATLQSYRSSSPFTANVGANTWNFEIYVPMNMIHPSDVRGLLPCYDTNVLPQLNLICQPLSNGSDPIAAPVYWYSGTGGSVAITGTVAVYADVVDGRTITQIQQLRPNLDGQPSVRLVRDQPLNGLTSGTTMRNKIALVGQHALYILTVVDALQNSKFASVSNINAIELGPDASGSSLFLKYGVGTNMSLYEFYNDLFVKLGQDVDEGIIPLVTGTIDAMADASLLEGHNFLNTTALNGWINANYGVGVNSVGASGTTGYVGARVEAHGLYLSDPLQIVSR